MVWKFVINCVKIIEQYKGNPEETAMKKIRPLRLVAVTAACILFTASALADSALVVTPKGPLNLRKSPTTNSNRIASIPNGTVIEVLDVDGDWAKATYNEKTGFVMTKFLRIESQLAGKNVYPDDYALVQLRGEPSDSSPALLTVDNLSGITAESVEHGWITVKLDDETTVYAPAASFSQQVTEAPKTVSWMAEAGETAQDCTLQVDGGQAVSLPAGTPLTVTMPYNGQCLVITDQGCGFLPMSAVRLLGPEDTGAQTGTVTPQRAVERAQEALRKSFKGVANEALTSRVAVYRNVYGQELPYYQVGFYNTSGGYAYGVLVSAETAKAVYSARYNTYAGPASAALSQAPVQEAPAQQPAADPGYSFALDLPGVTYIVPEDEAAQPAPAAEPIAEAPAPVTQEEAPVGDGVQYDGEIEIAYTGDIELGDVEDLEVYAWTDYQASYVIMKDGKSVLSSGMVDHFSAAYRPREAGDYTAVITVTDADGQTAVQELSFSVADADTEGMLYDLYSQKDGWWLSQGYFTSSLDQDGGALFTLAHAMYRIGVDNVDMLPENMAAIYNFTECLTDDGVDNKKLVKAAAEYFGFKTEDAITDAARIRELLEQGAVFSFTNAQGNVVLAAGISQDGTLVNIIDPNPGASFADGIPEDTVFLQQEDGSFTAIRSLDEDPYIRWYFETASYGGSEYWQKLDAVAPNGLLLIQAAE